MTSSSTPWPRNQRQRTFLGALTVWPVVYMVLFFVVTAGTMLLGMGGSGLLVLAGAAAEGSAGAGSAGPGAAGPVGGILAVLGAIVMVLPFLLFPVLFLLHGLTILLMLGLTAWFGHHVYQNRSIPENDRIVMMLGVLFLGAIGGWTWYWYHHIRVTPQTGDSVAAVEGEPQLVTRDASDPTQPSDTPT